ncbi:MAG: amino acid permease [Neisseriaceae bacterium]|jgi:arginine:agmatine antiporter|nr:MAG: amino acid permease [Neisseriaceae bacterium]
MQVVKNSAKIGLFAAMFMVTSNMLGSGVYMLPASLAGIGGVSLIGWGVALIGVIALALVFAKLAVISPNGAGPYSYARQAFGHFVGYQTNFVYSLANWIALVSMLTIIVGYLGNIFPIFKHIVIASATQIIIIWLFVLLNISGAKIVGYVQSTAFIFAIIPLLFVAVAGWHWFDMKTFMDGWNVTGQTPVAAVNASFNNIMWAFIGVESACVSASVVSNPNRNIPLATLFGVLVASIIYISTCTVMMGIIPNHQLATSSAPFADVLAIIFHSHAAGIIMSIIAIIDVSGAMAGWTLVTGQTARAAAEDGLFPKVFAKTNKKGMPVYGLIILAFVMSIIVVLTASPSAQEQFNKIITMSVILYLIPYIYSAFAVMVLGIDKVGHKAYWLYSSLGIVAAAFCMWSILGSDKPLTVWAFLVMISSTVFYAFKHIPKKSKV